jgi:two-component system sensor histidine kinase CiaH
MKAVARPEDSRTHAVDGQALRRTRLRLAAWSGAITFVVMVLLGASLYAVASRQLAQESEDKLRARAEALASDPFFGAMGAISMAELRIVGDAELPGLVFGGPLSGTVAGIIDPALLEAGQVEFLTVDPAEAALPISGASGEAARELEEQVFLGDLEGTPIRVLTTPVEVAGGTMLAQVLSDRSAEVRTLESLLLVLLVAVPLAAIAAGLAGWVYSGRALVPIRRAMARQRQFAADASHELRTPLAVLSGNLEVLARTPGRGANDDEALADAMAETERMAALLDDLLILARTDAEAFPVALEQIDLADEAAEAMDSLAGRAAARSVTLGLDMEPTTMRGDAERLRQLVVILVDNAIRYGSEGGHVWLSVRPAGHHARLSVADDGPGIAPADRARIFDRFWRGDAAAGESGNGLGLAIAHWIVAAHGGTVTVDERPDGGARFEISLPA